MYYYTYEIKFLCGSFKDKYYYGRRASRCKPENDIKYTGSGVIPGVYFNKYKPSNDTYEKTILGTYVSLEDLIKAEQELLDIHVGKEYCVNFNTNSVGGGCNKNRISVYKNNRARYIYPEYLDEFLHAGYTLGRMKGQQAWNKGIKATEDQIQKNRESTIKLWEDQTFREKVTKTLYGNKRALGHRLSEESKQMISDKNKGVITINNGEIEKHIHKEELDFYKTLGFEHGRLQKNIYHPSEEIKNKLSKSLIGKNKGKKLTDEQKKNLSNYFKGTKLMTDGKQNKYVKIEEIEKYKNLGWSLGRTPRSK